MAPFGQGVATPMSTAAVDKLSKQMLPKYRVIQLFSALIKI